MAATTHSLVTSRPVTTVIEDESVQVKEKETAIMVEPVNPSPTDSETESQAPSTRGSGLWEPGVIKQFPWLGIGALLLAVGFSIAELATLLASRKKPASEFLNGRLAPNVLLNIFSSLGTLALTLAVGQGVAISWWRRALTGGTVKELHYSWSFTTGLGDILRKMKYFNIIALAVLMAKISIVDGILYQKAIQTYVDMVATNYTADITFFAAQVLPWTGNMGLTNTQDGLATYDYESQILTWDMTGKDMDTMPVVSNCNGMDCHYFLQGAGFSMSCDSSSTTVDYGKDVTTVIGAHANTSTTYQNLTLFAVNFTRSWPTATKNYSAINLDMVYAEALADDAELPEDAVCPMNLTTTTCELRPAILRYKLQYTNGSALALSRQRGDVFGNVEPKSVVEGSSQAGTNRVSQKFPEPYGVQLDYDCSDGAEGYYQNGCGLYSPEWHQVEGVHFIKNADVVESFEPGANSTLEGLFLAMEINLGALSQLHHTNDDWSVDTDGVMSIMHRQESPEHGSCNFLFADPMLEVMSAINILTLMTVQNEALYYEANSDPNSDGYDHSKPLGKINPTDAQWQTVEAEVDYKDVFYYANAVYMYIALAATILVAILILPIYWGYWQLGRKVTLGPIEIARAFHGPAFEGVSGDHVDEVIKSVGEQKVIYEARGPQLGFRLT